MKQKTKRIIFEPDIDFTENQIYNIENEIIDSIGKKLGSEWGIKNWNLEIKCVTIAKLKKNDK